MLPLQLPDAEDKNFFISRHLFQVRPSIQANWPYSKDPGSSPGGDACFSH